MSGSQLDGICSTWGTSTTTRYPLAYRLQDPGLVSVWCTKQYTEQSFVRIEAARERPSPSADVLVARTTASASTLAYKEQIYAAVAGTSELPAGPVRLELAFVVGPTRNWLNLWKQTIDSLDPLLGRANLSAPGIRSTAGSPSWACT